MQIGIIGLPNVGKSTLFNALLRKQAAFVANYPFATIEPNVGMVDVPDLRLEKLSALLKLSKTIPAVVKFVDIAGLVKGASEGEGLGNKFLSHIRQVDALVHVIRDFEDETVAKAGAKDPKSDREVVETELILADLQTLNKKIEREQKNSRSQDKTAFKKLKVYEKLSVTLNKDKGELGIKTNLSEEEKKLVKELNLLTLKPIIYVYNVDEEAIIKGNKHSEGTDSIQLCAKFEDEISKFSEEEQKEYLKDMGLRVSGLDKVIKRGYDILNLQTFFSIKSDELRAWTIQKNTKAPKAAGAIHGDFEKGFIAADVSPYKKLVSAGSWKKAKEKGFIRTEGKNYQVRDGDVIEFKFSV